MSEVQDPQVNSPDPRWIALRVSRVNLGIMLLGALLAFPVMMLLDEVALWIRLALVAGLVLSMAWDLRMVLLKAPGSVGAFYLLDLDRPPAGLREAGANSPRLGIHIRLAHPPKRPESAERDGIVLRGSFVSPWFTALRYRLSDDAAWRRAWPRVIPLWPDSLDASKFREIRVALKWK